MPLYDYAPACGHCERCDGRFEVFQSLAEPKLAQCPTCGQACERLISPVALGGKYSTSDKKVKDLGMTKYRKAEDGIYERVVGSEGPEILDRRPRKAGKD